MICIEEPEVVPAFVVRDTSLGRLKAAIAVEPRLSPSALEWIEPAMSNPADRLAYHVVPKTPLVPAVPRINVTELYSIREWSTRYGCTSDQLRAAVDEVGNIASDVEKRLGLGRLGVPAAALHDAFSGEPSMGSASRLRS